MTQRDVFTLGFLSGLRSVTPLMFVSQRLARDPLADGYTALPILRMPWVAALLPIAAAGEIIADKLPFVPARISLFPLVGRIGMGALTGFAVSERPQDVMSNAMWGGLGAIVGTYVGYSVRRALNGVTTLRDLEIAIIEDVIVVLGSSAVTQQPMASVSMLRQERI